MDNLIVTRKVTRQKDGSIYVEWRPENEEIKDIAYHGSSFSSIDQVGEYEIHAHMELVNCINTYFEQELYQVNVNSVEHSLYIKRQQDGQKAVSALMSELRNMAKASPDQALAREVNRIIEIAFEKVTQNVLLGWWVTAREQCELVPVGGYISQQLWDRVYNTITNYINENY